MNMFLYQFVSDSLNFVNSEFGFVPEVSQLKVYSAADWRLFYEANKDSIIGFQGYDEGLYVPKSYCAYVHEDSPVLVPNVFHEFFGHGLFCEHSSIGKSLVEIIQEGGDANGFLYSPIDPNVQPLGLTTRNIGNYEGFALWLEALLCEQTGNEDVWKMKRDKISEEYVGLFEFFKDTEQKLTRFGFMAQLGFPKHYNPKRLVDTLKHLLNSNIDHVNFIILYGSQKPESDIDLFVVSNRPSTNYFNGWLDIYELSMEDFENLVGLLDISVTDPLFCGDVIYGDVSLVDRFKEYVLGCEITQEAIQHNLRRAKEQSEYARQSNPNSRDFKLASGYAESYEITARELGKGNKVLTLANI